MRLIQKREKLGRWADVWKRKVRRLVLLKSACGPLLIAVLRTQIGANQTTPAQAAVCPSSSRLTVRFSHTAAIQLLGLDCFLGLCTA